MMQNEGRLLKCPRDGSQLHTEKDHAIEIDAWDNVVRLDHLESAVGEQPD